MREKERLTTARLVVAGVSSGVGKTTVTLALAAALRRRGLRVACFKCGPDYLDPGYHRRVCGRTVHNLDGWMMGRESVLRTFAAGAVDADIALIEGMMGLYDGLAPDAETGSTAELAKWLAAPTLLVIDASAMARSAAAATLGFASFDPQVPLAGWIANRLGGPAHLDLLRRVGAKLALVGGFSAEDDGRFAERHLGLRSADEASLPEHAIDLWARRAEAGLDLDRIQTLAREAPGLTVERHEQAPVRAATCRIGVARDEAFSFYYPENLALLEAAGAELVFFSPVADQRLPAADGLYIGGGYPELVADRLAHNGAMRAEVQAFHRAGKPIYAECGGLMALTERLVTLDGRSHVMFGLLPGVVEMCERLQALGYVEVETRCDSPLGPAGTRFRGHQFRYSKYKPGEDAGQGAYCRMGDATGSWREGWQRGSLLASYVHGHWALCPEVPRHLVAACIRARPT